MPTSRETAMASQTSMARTSFAFAIAIVFLAAGAGKLIDHAQAVEDFTRWGLPMPGALTIVVGIFELAAAGLLMAGVALRPVALALAVEMAAALAIAGPVDHGAQLVVPPVLIAACLLLALIVRPPRRVRTG
jgi:uncharacterized membrane protein YphA (DoxX/SURF4 family)